MGGKIISVLSVLAVVFVVFTTTVKAADDVKITPIKITDQIYMISGQGGNIGLFLGEDGTFLIDDQFAPLTEKI